MEGGTKQSDKGKERVMIIVNAKMTVTDERQRATWGGWHKPKGIYSERYEQIF